jgi:hypothetical protein
LEQVQTLSSQHRGAEASSVLTQTLVEIARSNPELCAALIAAQMGHRQITLQQTVQSSNMIATDRRIFGLTYGQDIKRTTTTTTTTRTIRLH